MKVIFAKMPICIKPMEDELLYGWMLRLARENRCKCVRELVDRFMSERSGSDTSNIARKSRLDFVLNLDNICREYDYVKSFPSTEQILAKMTPLYTVFPFFSYGYQAQWEQFILNETVKALSGGNTAGMVKEIHVCPMCMESDISQHGFAYLHTWHHLPGTRMCAVHKVPLRILAHKRNGLPNLEGLKFETLDTFLVGSEESALKISSFMKSLYDNPVFVDIRSIQIIFRERMRELGISLEYPYNGLEEKMMEAEYLPYIHGNCNRRVRIMLEEPWHKLDEIIAFTVFMFGGIEQFLKKIKEYDYKLSDGFERFIEGRFLLVSKFGQMVKLRCMVCGHQFHIHPYALALGCGCPKCEKKFSETQIANQRLKCLGDGKYKLQGTLDGQFIDKCNIIHETCGNIRTMRLADAIWLGKKCRCETQIDEMTVRKRVMQVSNEFNVIKYSSEDGKQMVTLEHKNCGGSFEVNLRNFTKRGTCLCCERIRPRGYTTKLFSEKVRELVGEEYRIVNDFEDQKKEVQFLHNKCGTITSMRPSEFLTGQRCALCRISYTETDIREAVNLCTGGFYHITDVEEFIYTVVGRDGETFRKDAGFIMQELSRPTHSRFFRVRMKKPEMKERLNWLVYQSAKETCDEKGYWRSIYFEYEGVSKNHIRAITKWLVDKHYLERIGYGKYVISEERMMTHEESSKIRGSSFE